MNSRLTVTNNLQLIQRANSFVNPLVLKKQKNNSFFIFLFNFNKLTTKIGFCGLLMLHKTKIYTTIRFHADS